MEESRFLMGVQIFAGLGTAELSALSRRLRRCFFYKGETLFTKGQHGSEMYLIKSGLVRVFSADEHGQEISLALLSAGDFLGEMAVLDDQPRSASAVAMEDTEVLSLSRQDFKSELAANPQIANEVIRALVRRLRQADELVEGLSFLDVYGRVARKLLELASSHGKTTPDGVSIEIGLTQRDLASLVGATRETVNRAIAHYQEMGLIAVQREHITIVKPEGLKKRIG